MLRLYINELGKKMNVYSAPNITMVAHIKNVLEMHGITSEIRGEYKSFGAGELPPTECWIELWVTDESKVEQSKQIIKEALESAENNVESWKCPSCSEEIEGQFSECWNCGTSRYKDSSENQ